MTMNAKSNAEMREILTGLLGESNPFSTKGLHYLACRMSGSKYQKPLAFALRAMQEGRLQDLVPNELKEGLARAFGFEGSVPDPALIIIGTGRRPIKGKKGWDEASNSLFSVPINLTPESIAGLDKKAQEKALKQYELRVKQQSCAQSLLQVFWEHVKPADVPIVEETPPESSPKEEPVIEKAAPAKKAKVVPIKPKAPPPTEEVIKENTPVKKPKGKKPKIVE